MAWLDGDPLLDAAAARATLQGGVLTRAQAIELGFKPAWIDRLVRRRRWKSLVRGIYRVAPGNETHQRLAAACLSVASDALISHRAAAALWGLEGFEQPQRFDVTFAAPGRRMVRTHSRVHRASDLDTADRDELHGVACTSLERTVIDLAGILDEESLATAVESAWRIDQQLLLRLHWRILQLGRQGRRGLAVLQRIVRRSLRRKRPLDSRLEVAVELLILRNGLPRPESGLRFEDDFGHPGFIDFAYAAQRLAIECDGYEHHGTREGFERDAARLSRLAALGWRVIHVTWRQLQEDPEGVLERIRSALAFRPRASVRFAA